jgi:hypothetical protein
VDHHRRATAYALIQGGAVGSQLGRYKSQLALGDSRNLQMWLGEEGMKCLRVYADEKGESHFSEMEIAMSESQLILVIRSRGPAPRLQRISSF